MERLRPFFRFYGGKWRSSWRYEPPHHSRIIEPFAGAAGYSTRYWDRTVELYDADPAIVAIWDFLIHASRDDIRRLPARVENAWDVKACYGAQCLIGFWMNTGAARVCSIPSAWMRSGKYPTQFWGEHVREVLAHQVQFIRHWRVKEGPYHTAPNVSATWFVDPPYSSAAGRRYRFANVDYAHLANWCCERRGYTIVCEQAGATWLPFTPLAEVKSRTGKSREVVHYIEREDARCAG